MSNLKKWFPFKFNRTAEKEDTPKHAMAKRQEWNDPFVQMEQEMNQLMQSFFGRNNNWFTPALSTRQSSNWFGNFAPHTFSPLVDVTNEANHLVVSAELPGMTKEDVEATIHDGTLLLSGEKRHERSSDEDGCFRTERFFGSFQRAIPLPADVDPNGAEAKFADGVLTVKFPKVELDSSGPQRLELG